MPVQARRESIIAKQQAPLRQLYTAEPQEALTRKAARTTTARVPANDPFHGEVEIGDGYGAYFRFGLDRQVGGLHDAPNPGDLMCAALAACTDGAIRMLADLLGVELTALEVEVTGDVDLRGCLRIGKDVRVGFENLSCNVTLAAAAGTSERRLASLVTSAEKVCVNLDTLRTGIEVTTTTRAS